MGNKTEVTSMRIRQRRHLTTQEKLILPDNETLTLWKSPNSHTHAETLLRNLAVASALVLCAVTLRSGAIPAWGKATDLALAAAADHSLLDEQLGKLSFVSSMFPEAVLVFGENRPDDLQIAGDSEAIVHTWSEAEPYLSWAADTAEVYSVIEGEVSGVFHGNGEEMIVEIFNTNGLRCIYGNLDMAFVKTGDVVSKGTVLGMLAEDRELVLEVFREGISVDPAIYFQR